VLTKSRSHASHTPELQDEDTSVGEISDKIIKGFPGSAKMRAGYAISFLLQDNLLTRAQVRRLRPGLAWVVHTPLDFAEVGWVLRPGGHVSFRSQWCESFLLSLHNMLGNWHFSV
jgi:hypothetical protein